MIKEGILPLFSDYIRKGAKEHPERPALIFREQEISYRQFEKNAERIAKFLIKIGVKKGDRIGYILTTRPEFFYLYAAASMIGAILVGLSVRFTKAEIEHLLADAEVNYLFTVASLGDKDFQKMISDLVGKTLNHVVVVGGKVNLPHATSIDEVLANDYPEYDEVLRNRERDNKADDGLLIVYTSGSTGVPKGALQSNRNIVLHGLIEAYELGLFERDTVGLNHAPVNHVSGANLAGSALLIANATVVLLEVFDPAETLRLIEKYKVTFLGQVPTMFAMELALPNFDSYDLSSLRVVGSSGAPAQAVLIEQVKKRMCSDVRNALGMTEACGEVSYTKPDADLETICNTVGISPPGIERKIVDNNRRPVPDGTIGEVAFRSEILVKGYYNKPEETAAVFDEEGWFYTGDLGLIRPDGNLQLVGRAKEMYITGGFNVYPAEIENAIMRFPGVLTVAVLGVPHKLMGEVGRAYVIPKPGAVLNPDEIVAFLREQLADYKVPREIVIREQLPMTPLGKIEKRILKQEIAATTD